jgi:hypothetical protein
MSDAGTINLAWEPPGPVAEAFYASTARIQLINGPVGSGKTTAALMKGVKIARQQRPSRRYRIRDPKGEFVPVRHVRMTVVRDTYRQLWRSTIPSWWKRMPQSLGTWTGGLNAPATHRVPMFPGDGTGVDLHVDFAALGDLDVEEFMRGYEPTFWYLNELDLLAQEVMAFALGRAGRYPDAADGGPTWYGVLADCNAPEFESWLYREIFLKTPAERAALGIDLFIQPGGRDPGAENLANLPADYYEPKAGQAEWYIARMIDNKPGYSRAGKPIYPEFNDRLHVAPGELELVPGLPLGIGIDGGGSPAAVFGQRLPSGRWYIIDELITEHGTGPMRFGDLLAQRLRERFPNAPKVQGWADPSTTYGADVKSGEKNWKEIVESRTRIRIDPAPSNAPSVRWEAVRKPLQTLIDGEPAFKLSPRCRVIRAGFNNGYHFRRMQVPGAERFDEQAEKNDYCVPVSTQALTPAGWRKYHELKPGDPIYGFELTTERIALTHVESVNVFPGAHRLIRISGDHSSFETTGQHRHVVAKTGLAGYELVRTTDLLTNHSLLCAASEQRPRKQRPFSDAFISLAAWVMAEGSYRPKDDAIVISQSHSHNPAYCDYLDRLAEKFPGIITLKINKRLFRSWRITQETAWLLRHWMPGKIPSAEFIALMSNGNRRRFLYEFLRGDGHAGGPMPDPGPLGAAEDFRINGMTPRAFQKSPDAVAALQMIATLSGIKTVARPAKNGFVLTVFTAGNRLNINQKAREIVETDEAVWCPTTSLGTWICRQDGRTFITGNSHPHDALQYLCLGAGEFYEVLGRGQERMHARRQTQAIDMEHPRGEFRVGAGRQEYAIGE